MECVTRARAGARRDRHSGEVIVVDNGSTDGSAELAERGGRDRVVHEPRRGYGSAYLAGFAAARGDYIVMIDADLTYDFARDPALRARARRAARELVMGNRMENIQPGRDAAG